MRFIRSEFRGQLPKLFEKDSKTDELIFQDFNDLNQEEISRYVDLEKCHYLIDSSKGNPTENEPDYSRDEKNWTTLASHKMLDLANSPVIIRSFYLPFFSDEHNRYFYYKLLRNNNLFVNNVKR